MNSLTFAATKFAAEIISNFPPTAPLCPIGITVLFAKSAGNVFAWIEKSQSYPLTEAQLETALELIRDAAYTTKVHKV